MHPNPSVIALLCVIDKFPLSLKLSLVTAFYSKVKYVTNLASCQDEEICIAFTTVEIRRFHALSRKAGLSVTGIYQ
jgi:hypothetical protein